METRSKLSMPLASEADTEVNLPKLLENQTRHFTRSAYESYFYMDRNLVGVMEEQKMKSKPEKKLDA